jgi:hypothetical protein
MATAALDRTRAVRASPNQAKAMTGSRLSNTTLKLVETIARCRIRWSTVHDPPGGVSADVTAVNPAITTAIWAIPMSRTSLGTEAC